MAFKFCFQTFKKRNQCKYLPWNNFKIQGDNEYGLLGKIIKCLTSKTFVFMQSCPRWLPLVWFTRPSVVTSQINSRDSGKYPLVWFTRPSVVTSQINSRDPGKYLPELPNFMQYYTWCHAHVVRARRPRTSSAHVVRARCPRMSSAHVVRTSSARPLVISTSSVCHLCMRICCPHQDTSSAHHLYIICTATHGHRGPELSFTVTGICYWMEFVAGMLNCFISGLCKWFAR